MLGKEIYPRHCRGCLHAGASKCCFFLLQFFHCYYQVTLSPGQLPSAETANSTLSRTKAPSF